MRLLKWGSVALLVGLIVAVITAPIGPMPGVFIRGTASGVPTSWGDTSSIVEIDLQVGEGPLGRTVTIWTVQVDGDLYVTGQKHSGWVSGIAPGGPVRMQMDGERWDLLRVQGQTPQPERSAEITISQRSGRASLPAM